jgi:hypothetical protein
MIVSVRVLIKLKWTVINPSELVLDGATLNSAPSVFSSLLLAAAAAAPHMSITSAPLGPYAV